MAKSKLSPEAQVAEYLAQLDHPLKNVVEALRKVVLAASPEIAEQVKWKSAAFYYNGEMKTFDAKEYKRDIVVFNLNKQEYVLLVFPTGAAINDTAGLLEGNYPDGRRMAKFSSIGEVKEKEKDLQSVLQAWLRQVEK
ncbi:DUF1801 domain-containing protein [Chitinophaga sp. GCM10012297]|uniref:DUF1801 domain-containing protein n=1 Tax=Chitinophaga chungangae TaxID=2821488 RepID=A0ABS3YC20_9BACT|nr:DUF1801 domain-containing protein [Chitinophaga chungangae]MBO9152223.1 DUF1801 domain-containing protein [Chitinophaga chungangae]